MNTYGKEHRRSGMTLVEIMMAMFIAVIAITAVLDLYLTSLRLMYKDEQRQITNATLRQILSQITQKALDSTSFYLFPNYTSLDGSVDITSSTPNTSPRVVDAFGTNIARGDCLVLVSQATTSVSANIRRIRIFYRVTNSADTQAPLRLYESPYYGDSGTTTSLQVLLNGINLNSNPLINHSVELAPLTIGKKQAAASTHYPVFSSETPIGDAPSPGSVAVNLEIVNGTSSNNLVSSSSFYYIISPRK